MDARVSWPDLFQRRGTRRDFLRVSGSVAGLVALGALPSCGRAQRIRFVSDPFALGVASGDPAPGGVVLWTRLDGPALESAGVARRAVEVGWEVAEDDGFRRIVRDGRAEARPELGHSVHVEVEGLRPGREYFYRLFAGDASSPVGRSRTGPAPGAAVDRLRMAVASCQNYEHGHFTALRHLSEEDIDLVVHLGDYIYERTFGQNQVRRHESGEVVTLDEYRARYTTYRRDADLQAAHLAAPWIVTADDHEVANNYAADVPQVEEPRDTFLLRRAAAYQAFYEFMPLRRSSMPSGPTMPLYRGFSFGRLLDMSVLDTRQYRSDQPCGDGTRPSCPEHVDPDRSMLGGAQRDWLFRRLAESDARWTVVAQQVLVARLRGRTDDGTETWSMDKWDGYPAERQALLDLLAAVDVPNPVVVTGDIHSNWVADLHRDFDDLSSAVVGTELVGTSLSSGGDGRDTGAAGLLANNPHIRFYNGQRGYLLATITPERWTTDFRVVPVVTRPGGEVRTRATFVIENGRPGAREA